MHWKERKKLCSVMFFQRVYVLWKVLKRGGKNAEFGVSCSELSSFIVV